MIHYITVGVALERPPKADQYRRYAIYGGTHQDAELVATQMAACTSTMPVGVIRDRENGGYLRQAEVCARDCIPSTPLIPHGVDGCTCEQTETPDGYITILDAEATDAWAVNEQCPHHGWSEVVSEQQDEMDVPYGQPPHECETSRCWEECERGRKFAKGGYLPPYDAGRHGDEVPAMLSQGVVTCVRCQQSLTGTELQRYMWLVNHSCLPRVPGYSGWHPRLAMLGTWVAFIALAVVWLIWG